jgi:hypothetical protein
MMLRSAFTAKRSYVLGADEGGAFMCWLDGIEPSRHIAAWTEENAFRVNQVSRYTPLQAAVGALLVRDIESRLPTTAVFFPRLDLVAVMRRGARPARGSGMSLIGRHLFSINWADGGPGMAWPTAYYTIWVPIIEQWVVTASDDSGSMLGFLDVALGAFPGSDDWQEGVCSILKADWTQWAKERQPRWEELTSLGVLGAEVIYATADAAWSASDEGDQEIEA